MTDPAHQISVKAATVLLRQGEKEKLDWKELAIAMENTITLVVIACAQMSRTPQPERFCQEVMDTITERAHVRISEAYREGKIP